MTIFHGHKCDSCKMSVVTEGNDGLRQHNRDAYDPTLPDGWRIIHGFPTHMTLCKQCLHIACLPDAPVPNKEDDTQ